MMRFNLLHLLAFREDSGTSISSTKTYSSGDLRRSLSESLRFLANFVVEQRGLISMLGMKNRNWVAFYVDVF